jgi:hypothetical protein
MRRGLYFVLMMVLVLRGLAGTAMAAGVLPPLPAHGAEQHKGQQHHQGAADAQPDAESLMGTADPETSSHHGPQAAHTSHAACDVATSGCAAQGHHAATCSACEICHSAMLDVPALLSLLPATTSVLLARGADPFDSAPAALAIKPPIA